MSKPSSGHFKGTTGYSNSQKNGSLLEANSGIITAEKLDMREHPTKYKQLSSKKLKALREKLKARTITKEEYKHLEWQRRLTNRRNEAIRQFWAEERKKIKRGLPTTRNWSAEQRKDILAGKIPKFKGRAMASHHRYSVSRYPHLANRKEFIYPATFYEHIYGFHGGNTRNSLPGVPIKYIKEF